MKDFFELREHIKGGSDSYYALQKAKEKAKRDGKVWDKMGQDERDRYTDKEMKAAGYEKKPGNTQWTKVQKPRGFRSGDKPGPERPSDRVKRYADNPGKSTAGPTNLSDIEKLQVQVKRLEDQRDRFDEKASQAQDKMFDAEERDDDEAYEKYQEEDEYWQEKSQDVEYKINDLKDKIKDMKAKAKG